MKGKYIDLVISGCDFSGTTNQINELINYFDSLKFKVKDLRGTEIDALFHSQIFSPENASYKNLNEFLEDKMNSQKFMEKISSYMIQKRERLASCVHNEVSEFINPNSADVWIMEEPTKRGAGQVVRQIELYRSKYGDRLNQISAAFAHQAYRTDEFLRFRKPLREAEKIILRSRSEESACYQIQDEHYLPRGIPKNDYLSLPGHLIAFANPPTHIFIVHGPADWKIESYIKLKQERIGKRILDDHEKDVNYQIFINKRYATDWLEKLYEEGCSIHGSKVPKIIRFDIYHSKEQIANEMVKELKGVIDE